MDPRSFTSVRRFRMAEGQREGGAGNEDERRAGTFLRQHKNVGSAAVFASGWGGTRMGSVMVEKSAF